jgi:hypothetical protein
MMVSANFVKLAAREMATKLMGKKHPLCIELIRLSEMNALKIRQAAYPDHEMGVKRANGKLQEMRPHTLPEGFDPESVEACAGDVDLLETMVAQCVSEGYR